MWRGWDECQRSESRNKLLRQSEGRCVARVLHLSQQTYIPFVMKEAMSWVGWRNFNIQWCRGGLRVAEKVSSKRNQYPLIFTQNDYEERNEIYNRIFKFCCIDLSVPVRLYYFDCGRLESAASLRCDSNPVPQTNLGLTSLYSLLLFGWIAPVDWLPIGVIFVYRDRSLSERLVGGCI